MSGFARRTKDYMTGPQGKRTQEITNKYSWAKWIFIDVDDHFEHLYLFLVPQSKEKIDLTGATYLRMSKDGRIHHIVKGEVRTWNCTAKDLELIFERYCKLQTFQ